MQYISTLIISEKQKWLNHGISPNVGVFKLKILIGENSLYYIFKL